jgi:hypothetical protein
MPTRADKARCTPLVFAVPADTAPLEFLDGLYVALPSTSPSRGHRRAHTHQPESLESLVDAAAADAPLLARSLGRGGLSSLKAGAKHHRTRSEMK